MRHVNLKAVSLVVFLSTLTGGSPPPFSKAAAVQEAAIEFLSKQSSATACVHIAYGPGEMVDGMVARHLVDPPAVMVDRLRARGAAVQPYSACEHRYGTIVIAIGWPTAAGDEAEVNADWLCGPWCGNGYRVHLVIGASGWRALGAATTWMSWALER
jgi:hypothetical protein